MRVIFFALMTSLAASLAAAVARAEDSAIHEMSTHESVTRGAGAHESARENPAHENHEAAHEQTSRLRCMSVADTRKAIVKMSLFDPLRCMRETAARLQAEALGARLCQLGEAMLYEINLLHHDGRVQKAYVDAASGRPHSGRIDK